MEKSKCKAKVAALLMALVIVFIPFGSVFAAPVRGLLQVGHLGVENSGTTYEYGGTYYIAEQSHVYLTGEISNYRSGFNLELTVTNFETDKTIRRVKERITPPSDMKSIDLLDLCNPSTQHGYDMLCSKELVDAMDLRTLPAGYYRFEFMMNDNAYVQGRCVYVKVYNRGTMSFVRSIYDTFGISRSDMMAYYAFEIYRKNISVRDFIWTMYVNNPNKLNNMNPRNAVINICRLCLGDPLSSTQMYNYMDYVRQRGAGRLLRAILDSSKCQSYFQAIGFKA
ncbi:MAG: hypothetical protein J5653_05245 [Clostridiales bacterium]|nr:hypothetical protein [Clostridiales bacterium]